jgi:hypothetical protein
VAKVDRAQFLRLGAAGALGVAGVGLIAARPAAAALPAPNPVGDDIGFFGFAVVAELTSERCYQEALRVKGWPAGVRRNLSAAIEAKGAHVRRINDVLRDGAVQPSDYAVDFPEGSFDTRARALTLAVRLENLLVSTYLHGVSYAQDSSSRLMLGRLMSFDGQLLAWLRALGGGAPVPGLPDPVDTEAGGALLDTYLTIPSFR